MRRVGRRRAALTGTPLGVEDFVAHPVIGRGPGILVLARQQPQLRDHIFCIVGQRTVDANQVRVRITQLACSSVQPIAAPEVEKQGPATEKWLVIRGKIARDVAP